MCCAKSWTLKKIIKNNNNNNNNSKFKNKVLLLKTIKFFKSQWTDLSHITENKKFKLVTNNFFNEKKRAWFKPYLKPNTSAFEVFAAPIYAR